jgi:ribosomal protein S18 acetylase RimI-like enzyme
MRDGDGHAVGHLWFAAVGTGGARGGFVYDIHVKPEFRRRGHAALERLEAIAVEMELASIALRVFASNTGAQALYRAAGWDIASIDMRKPLQRT